MAEFIEVLKLAGNYGAAGVIVWFMWRLTNKWAGLFLEAQKDQVEAMSKQASAMTGLAEAMGRAQADQRDVLIAVQVIAQQIERQRAVLDRIEKNCRERGGCPQ